MITKEMFINAMDPSCTKPLSKEIEAHEFHAASIRQLIELKKAKQDKAA